MRYIALPLAFAAACLIAAPAAAVNYDCTKAGNATKTACKGKVPAPATKMAPKAAAPKMAAAAPKMAAAANTMANASHKMAAGPAKDAAAAPKMAAAARKMAAAAPMMKAAAPKMAAAKTPTGTAWTTKNGKVVHYNCAKTGNTTKQACKA